MTHHNPSLGVAIDELFALLVERRREMPEGSYTAKLLADENLALKKIGEEATEVVMAGMSHDREALRYEAADLIYHLLVVMVREGVAPGDVAAELDSRRK